MLNISFNSWIQSPQVSLRAQEPTVNYFRLISALMMSNICIFLLFFFPLLWLFIVFFSHLQKTGFVRQGALCCQRQESKIVSGDGAVKE